MDLEKKYDQEQQVAIRKKIHILFSIVLIAVIVIFKYVIQDASVITKLFIFAGYTYGPLLGLYSFGLFTKLKVKDKFIPYVTIASPIVSYIISDNSETWFGFEFGFFILILNGLLTFFGLILIRRK